MATSPTCRFLPLLLLLLSFKGVATVTIWEAVSSNSSFSIITQCIKQADPVILARLNDTGDNANKCTFFAPVDDAFESLSDDDTPCRNPGNGNETEITAMLQYLISPEATALPYLNQPFPTLLGENSYLYIYSISKDGSTPAKYPPILYVNNARALGWEAIGDGSNSPSPSSPTTHFLVPLDRFLQRPALSPDGNGTLWDVLQNNPNAFSTTSSLIERNLPALQALLNTLPDVVKHQGYHTLFAPDNDAWDKLPPERMALLQNDTQALQTLFSFHMLSNVKGDYPRSTTGMYYSEQFYPTTSFKARDIYVQFYQAQSSGFSGLNLPNDLGILLDISGRLDHDNKVPSLVLEHNSTRVTEPDLSAYNGVVHRLDGVLPLPEAIPSVLAAPPMPLASSGNFTIVTQLLNASAAMADALATGGPYTILAPTDDAFAAAFNEGRLPPLQSFLQDTDLLASLLQYWTVNSSQQLYLFTPDPYSNPFKDDFPDKAFLSDASPATGGPRRLFVHRQQLSTQSMGGKFNDTAVFVNGGRLYQCTEGQGWGHDCGSYPTPSNTYAINDDRIVNMVHAVDTVLLPPEGTLWDLIQADPELSTFARLLEESSLNLTALLDSSGVAATDLFTVFAPTNAALDALLEARPWLLSSSSAGNGSGSLMDDVLAYHLVPELWYARWLEDAQRLATQAFNGEAVVLVNASSSSSSSISTTATVVLQVNGQVASSTDTTARNGVLHKLDGVLVPDLLQIAYASAGLFDMVAALETIEGSKDILATLAGEGPYTLFGPMDAAFASIDASELGLEDLQYHVGIGEVRPQDINGSSKVIASLASGLPIYLENLNLTTQHPYVKAQSGLFVNQAELQMPVYRTLNGIVYAIDGLLQPPKQDIMALLQGGEATQGFAALLKTAGLDELFTPSSSTPWTVFAPTTSTLDKIYRKQEIFADARQLPELLSFHLIEGRRLFTPSFANVPTCGQAPGEGFCDGPEDLMSKQGERLVTQVVSRNTTFLSTTYMSFTAPVVRADIHATNGVVHLVDGFLTFEGYKRPR